MRRGLITRAAGVLEQELDGEYLLLRPGGADVLQLNATASALWTRLTPAADLSAVAVEVADDYGVPPEQVLADLEGVVEVLLAHGLVVEPAPGR